MGVEPAFPYLKTMINKEYKGLLLSDVDGTFFRWSLFLHMVDRLIENGIFNSVVRDFFREEEKNWRERKGSYDDYINKVIEIFESRIAGVYVKDLKKLCEDVAREYKDQVYRYTRDLIKEKISQGWYVAVISCSQVEVVEPFARAWGIHEVEAATVEIKDDKYTGVRHIPLNKAEFARRVMARPEFMDLPKENIWGIGDSEGDINFLELVGKPICFNPTLTLYQEAKKRGWDVVVERKNVIYHI